MKLNIMNIRKAHSAKGKAPPIVAGPYAMLLALLLISHLSFLPAHRAFPQSRQAGFQKSYFLEIKVPSEEKSLLRKYNYKTKHPDSLSAAKELQNLIFSLQRQSYITSTADSIWYSFVEMLPPRVLGGISTSFQHATSLQSDTMTVSLVIGKPYQWALLKKGNVSEELLTKIDYKEKFYSNKPFKYYEVVKLEKKILEYSEDHGYPFASIKLDSITITEGSIGTSLNFIMGPLIKFDSLVIKGDTKIKKRFLSKYIRVLPGQPYSQEKVESAGKLIKRLPYLKVVKVPVVSFNREKAYLNLYLDDKKANQINGIVGFLPNEEEDNEGKKKLLINGEFTLRLRNPFGTGKSIIFEWKKLKKLSQTLDVEYVHPNLIGSNIEAKIDVNFFKQDSTFVNIDRKITLSYHISKIGKVGFFTGLKSTTILLKQPILSKDYANTSFISYGLVYEWNNLNDYYYPQKGNAINVNLGIGNKNIKQLDESLSENVELKTTQVSFTANVRHYSKLGLRSVFLTALNTSSLNGFGTLVNNNLFKNDLFRIGGLKSLRGFNESTFFASTYVVGTLEYRFFTDETSYLLLFYDQGYLTYDLLDILDNTFYEDFPLGLGAGISFSTKAGIFNFIYSVGKSKDQPIGLNFSKIHFGLISQF
ncbi:MAG: BamA/TamA family outer membrane protein [Cytophagales bacterium]|nr:BamA/TamA family outer membrane protein [Cytophagales bacterium]